MNDTIGTKTLYFLIPCDTYPEIVIGLKADGVAADVDLPVEPIPCPLQQSCGKEHTPRQITKEEYDEATAEDDDYDTYEAEERISLGWFRTVEEAFEADA